MSDELDFNSEIQVLLSSGTLNTYMAHYLSDMGKEGLNEKLWQEAMDDAIEASVAGVDSEEEFLTFFYIDHFVEQACEDIFGVKLDDKEEAELKYFMFDLRGEVDFGALSTYHGAVLQWLQSKKDIETKAHPNRKPSFVPLSKYNIENWKALAERIAKSVMVGFSRAFALKEASSTLGNQERFDFLVWYKYFVTGENTKYDVNSQIKAKNREIRAMAHLEKQAISFDSQYYYIPKYKEEPKPAISKDPFTPYDDKDASDFQSVRKKLMSRIFAIDKLLEKYRKVLPVDQVDGIEDAMTELRKKVRKLKMATTISDTMIKTANILRNKFSFSEGADELIAIAAEQEGKDFEEPSAGQIVLDNRQTELRAIIEELYEVSHALKNRNLVRRLAEIDIRLHGINMSSFFPEITDAQSRLIDAYGYASNKVDDVLPRLQGGIALEALEDKVDSSEKGKSLADEVKDMSKNIKVPSEPKPQGAPTQKPVPSLIKDVEPAEVANIDVPLAG